MKFRNFSKQKGIVASEALIAVLIIILFSGLIATITYNIYLSNSSIKRMSKANSYIIDMFEYIDKNYYDDITVENLTNYFNNKYYYSEDAITPKKGAEVKIVSEEESIEVPFKAEIKVIKYNETLGNEDKFDLVKEITMKVSYKLGNKDQVIETTRIKQREKLTTPNTPNLNKLADKAIDKNIYSIKKVDNVWKICNTNDTKWYNYENGNWAVVLVTPKNMEVGNIININALSQEEAIYIWIPRYAYYDNKILFLYSNSTNYVVNDGAYNKLVKINQNAGENYKIYKEFTNDEEVEGLWTNDSNSEVYKTLNNVYPLKK